MNKEVLPYKYIVFEGIIGIGKTNFINKMSENINIKYIKNPSEENPFLENFYKDIENYSFQTQLFFLLSRYKQQINEIKHLDLFHQTIVSDYLFERDRIFAGLTLSEKEFSIYEQIYKMFISNIKRPDLVIYFHANPEVIMRKIRRSNKKYNKYISTRFIHELSSEFDKYFFYYDDTPLLIIETSNINLEQNYEVFEEILYQIKNLDSSRKFYNPVPELRLF